MDAQPRLLQPTRLLDFTHPAIEALIEKRGWRRTAEFERIGAVYDFVRNESPSATTKVTTCRHPRCWRRHRPVQHQGHAADGLAARQGIPCRCHGFTIDKALQKGAITGLAYVLAPHRIIHSRVARGIGDQV
jgi:hypothetical protein